ncbi:MAG TPA: hypothetical protein EYP49_09630 [Anaerolineae bacterium]|nr:hypothetical protein [Anaerolineae bacterium]
MILIGLFLIGTGIASRRNPSLGTLQAAHYLARAGLRLPLRPALLGLEILMSGLLVVHRLLHPQKRLEEPSWEGDAIRWWATLHGRATGDDEGFEHGYLTGRKKRGIL